MIFYIYFFAGGGGDTFDLENFPTSGVKGRILLEAKYPVGHLLLQPRSSTVESHT